MQNPEITLNIYENLLYDKCDIANVESMIHLIKCVDTIRYLSGFV